MNDILAITADPQSDDVLVSELAAADADRVTVFLPGCRPERDAQSAHRLVELVAKIEFVTGATVVGWPAPRTWSTTTTSTAWCTRPLRRSPRC